LEDAGIHDPLLGALAKRLKTAASQ
jgi:hypothetical protein